MNKENKEKVKPNVCLIEYCGRPVHKESKYCIFHSSAEEKTEEEFKEALKEYIDQIKEEDKDYDFKEFIFVGNINFNKDLDITLFKNADFEAVKFNRHAGFMFANFKGYANFDSANFNGVVSFRSTNFKGDANFNIETGNMSFYRSIFTQSRTLTFNIMNKDIKNKVKIDMQKTYLENVFLELDLGKKTLIDFDKAILRNTIIEKKQIENHILQEQEKKFSDAKEVYLLLKNNFHSIGKYKDESWAFKKEKDMERKDNCHFKTLHKWLWSCFLNGIFGYGEQPVKVIISAMSIILIFTFLFMSSGISSTGIGSSLSISKNFLDCVYFSTVTFTTLGYGDFRPLEGWGRIFAGTEAFIGALMMALFVYTFARRTGGR